MLAKNYKPVCKVLTEAQLDWYAGAIAAHPTEGGPAGRGVLLDLVCRVVELEALKGDKKC
jgi:hypothetical protein